MAVSPPEHRAPPVVGAPVPVFSILEVVPRGNVLVESMVEAVPAAAPAGPQAALAGPLRAEPGGAGRPHRSGGHCPDLPGDPPTDRPYLAQTIKLEGNILGPWVDEVRGACAQAMARSGRPRLRSWGEVGDSCG